MSTLTITHTVEVRLGAPEAGSPDTTRVAVVVSGEGVLPDHAHLRRDFVVDSRATVKDLNLENDMCWRTAREAAERAGLVLTARLCLPDHPYVFSARPATVHPPSVEWLEQRHRELVRELEETRALLVHHDRMRAEWLGGGDAPAPPTASTHVPQSPGQAG